MASKHSPWRLWLLNSSVALIAGLLLAITYGIAAPNNGGNLDPSFGNGGIVTTNIAATGRSEEVTGAVLQPDGKIVAAGTSSAGNFMVARYNPDGTLDDSFGAGGKVATDFDGNYDSAYAVALQADGKVVVAGSSNDLVGNVDFALARYNPDGSPDTTFGTGGKVTTHFDGSTAEANAVAVQADGKIVAAGYSVYTNYDFALVRYNPDGTLDATFGTGGKVITDFNLNGASDDAANAVLVQPDGKIVAGGDASPRDAPPMDFALARYNPDGSLDISFGAGGKVVTAFVGDLNGTVHSLARQSDGKIVAAGEVRPTACCPGRDFAMTRYNPGGSLDTSFGINGEVITDFNHFDDAIYAVAIQPDGKIVAVGTATATYQTGNNFGLARYNADGALDTSLGTSGKVITADTQGARAMVLQPDGKIVAAGDAAGTTTAEDFALVRYDINGTIDTAFGTGGRVTTDFGTGNDDMGHALALQPDNKIILVGGTSSDTSADFALARYNTDGALDSTFGTGGKVTTDFQDLRDEASAVTLQPDGKIIAAGNSGEGGGCIYGCPDTRFALARYNPDGTLDSTFGSGGKVVTDFSDVAARAGLNAIALQPDGTIVAAGYAEYICGPRCFTFGFALARYNANGSLDTSFGQGGRVLTPHANGYEVLNDLAVQPDGKLVGVGVVGADQVEGTSFALVRYNADGSLDTSFGTGGRVTTGFAGGPAGANGISILANGKLVVVGHRDSGSLVDQSFALARYNANGSLDASFGTGGQVTTHFDSGSAQASKPAIQTDGRIVVAGTVSSDCNYYLCHRSSFALARYDQAGNLDPTFGNGGKVVTWIGTGSSTSADDVALQVDGKLVVGGYTLVSTDGVDFALARYQEPVPPVPTPTIGPGCIFSDVCPSDYFFTGTQYLLNHGVISGYPNNTFRPYNNTTRGQLSKIVVLGEAWPIDTSGGPHFSDVPVDNPFYGYIETAYNHAIISGYPDGTFGWGSPVTRGQLCKIVVLAEGWPIDTSGGPHFSDVPVDNGFYGYIETAYNHAIISGYVNGTFRPGHYATRGQISKIVYNALTELSPTSTPTPIPTTTAQPTGTATSTPIVISTITPAASPSATASLSATATTIDNAQP